jgi:hypothetical protein
MYYLLAKGKLKIKKCIFFFLPGFSVLGICTAQEQEQENTWTGTVRFNPADLFINLHNALPAFSTKAQKPRLSQRLTPATTSIYAHRKEYYNWASESWKAYKAENENATKLQWANAINFDKDLVNELDPDLMERINQMFNNAR